MEGCGVRTVLVRRPEILQVNAMGGRAEGVQRQRQGLGSVGPEQHKFNCKAFRHSCITCLLKTKVLEIRN